MLALLLFSFARGIEGGPSTCAASPRASAYIAFWMTQTTVSMTLVSWSPIREVMIGRYSWQSHPFSSSDLPLIVFREGNMFQNGRRYDDGGHTPSEVLLTSGNWHQYNLLLVSVFGIAAAHIYQ